MVTSCASCTSLRQPDAPRELLLLNNAARAMATQPTPASPVSTFAFAPAAMSSCFGFRSSRADDQRPLLPQYRDDTQLQRELHQKLHSYQMIRALSKGFMPSNEQLIVNLRSLLAADLLNPDNPDLSDSGRLLVRFSKQWLHDFIDLLHHKNSHDQVQDFIWYLTRSRVAVDVGDIANHASQSKAKADTVAGAFRRAHPLNRALRTPANPPPPSQPTRASRLWGRYS